MVVNPEVLSQLGNAFRQQRYLKFSGTGVGLVSSVLFDYGLFLSLVQTLLLGPSNKCIAIAVLVSPRRSFALRAMLLVGEWALQRSRWIVPLER